MDDTLADPLAGRLLDGRYAVTARLAHGGMATVYLGMDTRLDREVALKVMHAELARDEDFVRRFIGEAKSVARLSHQNVVAVFDQGSDGPFLYLAMEYVPGRTLKEELRDRGSFTPAAALDIMAGVLAGLAAAHASGIVHRDVKPENVLLTGDGRIKVADFGLARAHWSAGHTRTGLLIGTVGYVPPEQVTGGATGPRSDVYSAGIMLFQLLTGRLPFTGDSPLSVAYQHVNSAVPAPSTLVPGIPPGVDQLVLAAVSRDPMQRPADAGEFLREVRRVREFEAPGRNDFPGDGGQTGGFPAEGFPAGDVGGFAGAGFAGTGFAGGPGVQGLGEAPWLDLNTPAATNGWWARTGAVPVGAGQDAGAGSGPGMSHTLVVHRREDSRDDEGGRYRARREPFLQRWLFSPRLLIVAGVLVLGVALGVGGWWLAAGRYTPVPTVAGDTVAQATAALKTNGFTVRKDEQVHSNTVAKGTVLGTSPTGRVTRGSAVSIVVSAGPFTSTVPKVAGLTAAAAKAALAGVHLSVTTEKIGSDAKIGTVVGTNPAAGTSWPQTKPVTLMVSAGQPLPDFVGENVQTAQQWAQQHDATLQQQPVSNSQAASGTITSQQPAAGGIVQQGETITVGVSTGPQEVSVPNVIGMSVTQATQELEALGFKVVVHNHGFFATTVFDFSPVGQAPKGSTITLDAQGIL